MLKIRLKRCGRKKHPIYRIVVMQSKSYRDGKPIKELGMYNPFTKEFKLDPVLTSYYIENGAKPTKTIENLLKKISFIKVK